MRQLIVVAALSLCSFMSYAGQIIHGPLNLPADEDEPQTLSFEQSDDAVVALVESEYTGKQTLDSFSKDTEIVAVFYQDLDGDAQREVIVMQKNSAGQRLTAYGVNDMNWRPLTRAQAKLDTLSAELKQFTVAATRKGLQAWPLEDFLVHYSTSNITDPLLVQLMNGEYPQTGKFLGYRDANGQPVTDRASAEFYYVQYPDSITDTVAGQSKTFYLTQQYSRAAYNMHNDGSGFIVSAVGYMAADDLGQYAGESVQYAPSHDGWVELAEVSHYQHDQLDGDYQQFFERSGQLALHGSYVAGVRQGQWTELDETGDYWQGDYQQGKKLGKWLQFGFDDQQVGFAHYEQGTLNGDYEETQPDYHQDDHSARVLYAKGRYDMGVKQGDWIERNGKGPYVDGKREGTWRIEHPAQAQYVLEHFHQGKRHGASQTFDKAGGLISEYQFENGVRNGLGREFYPNGNLKQQVHYRDNLKQGNFLSFYENGQPRWITPYVITEQDGKQVALKQGTAISFDEQGQLEHVQGYKQDKRWGMRYEFHSKTGKLKSFYHPNSEQEGIGGRLNDAGVLTYFYHSWNGRNVDASYQFYPTGALKEVEPWCQQIEQTWQGKPYAYPPGNFRCGIRRSFYEDGNVKCMRDYVEGQEQGVQCYSASGELRESQELTAADRAVKRSYYSSGALKEERPLIANYSTTIKGKQVYGFASQRRDGVVIQYSRFTGKPTYNYLFKNGKMICSQKLNLLGEPSAESANCKIDE